MLNGPERLVRHLITCQSQFYDAAIALQAVEDCPSATRAEVVPPEVDALERSVLCQHLTKGPRPGRGNAVVAQIQLRERRIAREGLSSHRV
jgi:hypothetical protein